MTKKTKYEGKWLNFYEISFTNSAGEPGEWEYAARIGSEGAACVIAIKDEAEPQLILIRQFRPPIGNYAIEFPAGLVDSGESIESAALRELEEETGYTGDVLHVGPPIFSSPGLTDEQVSLVTVKVTGQNETRHEPDEKIEVLTVPLKDLMKRLSGFQAEGTALDAKLWSFAQGLSWNSPGEGAT
ncbi:MAG: NUDIX hydrolase [Verrucomicrobia bacterium]|nr:NUDIX hydrolase [Verrucomicrobiota bacterium]